jgi:hypothetical protein
MKNNRKNRKLLWIRARNNFRKGKKYRNLFKVSDDLMKDSELVGRYIEQTITRSIDKLVKKFRLPLVCRNFEIGRHANEFYNDFTQGATTVIFDVTL